MSKVLASLPVGEKVGIDFTVIDLEEFRKGLSVELEHGTLGRRGRDAHLQQRRRRTRQKLIACSVARDLAAHRARRRRHEAQFERAG